MSEKILAYHGTNILFQEFSLQYAFSGEGYAFHGRGIYLALKRDVAEKYAMALSRRFLFSRDGLNRFDLSYGVDIRTIDEAVACVLHSLKNDASLDSDETIRDIAYLLAFNLKQNPEFVVRHVRQRYLEVSQWCHPSGYLYTVGIDSRFVGTDATAKARLYVGQEDGACLLVSDPSIIQIGDVERIPCCNAA